MIIFDFLRWQEEKAKEDQVVMIAVVLMIAIIMKLPMKVTAIHELRVPR
jgi:hypothetical protein